ncbi:MAG: DNA polymerase III subunit delta [Dehalococcoidia bacterium]|nr:DNA polymerase III subunit delta [Dehalococcoidia bacterium]
MEAWLPALPPPVRALNKVVLPLCGRPRTPISISRCPPSCAHWRPGPLRDPTPGAPYNIRHDRIAAVIHIFHGEDGFSRAEALAQLKGSLGPPEALAPNTSSFEAERATPDEVILACSARPFLGEHRLVIVEGALSTFEALGTGRRGNATSARSPRRAPGKSWLPLAEAASHFPATTTLVLLDGKVGRVNPLFKALSPPAQAREFALLRGPAVQLWAQERAARRGAHLEPAAARLLAELLGSNLWFLSSEIDKLAAYAGGAAGRSPITEADVNTLTSQAGEASVFALVDALVEGRRGAALGLLHRVLSDDTYAPQQILAMVARQLRLLVQAKELLQAGAEPQEVGRALGIARDFVLRKALDQARTTSFPRLEELYRLTLEADVATKTGLLRDELALDVLFAAGAAR